MANEIVEFDSNKVANAIKDKIKGTFVELIPDEVWNKMIAAEIEKFTQPAKDRWDTRTEHPSELAKLVKAELEIELRSRVRAFFQTPEWQGKWVSIDVPVKDVAGNIVGTQNTSREEMSVALRKAIIDAAPEILAALIGRDLQQALRNMR